MTITEGFAEQVANAPDNPAVLADDGTATYGELAAKATAVAALLREPGGTGPVALLCRHGVTMISTMLGVLAAGRAYVPLDPTFPVQRLAFQLADSGATALLTDADNAPLARSVAAGTGPDPLDVDPVLTGSSTMDISGWAADPDATAYLLYTSGSTGTPKGVRQSHRNVVFSARNHIRSFGITAADRTSVLTSFGFDMAVTDTFSALLAGAAAAPIDIRARGLAHLAEALDERGVTVYHSTPTVFRYLVANLGARTLPRVRVAVLGGEEVTARDVRTCRQHMGPDCVFVNGYGATEVSFITQHHLPPGVPISEGVLPIGRPLPGIEVVLLDSDSRENPTEGEILVRSKHVALGYQGLSEGRFGTLRGERSYRTGDLARWLPDGTLAFLGRADRQVKLRGFRVELGEVETQLADLPGVAQAAVLVRRDELVGYVVPKDGFDTDTVRAMLGEVLPDYMVPRVVVTLAELPLTETGKLDERALPDPPAPGPSHVDAFDGVAAVIAEAWCAVLGLPAVGRDDNFYELGGHSLLMALVHEQLESTLGRSVALSELFANPTVAGLAAHLSGDGDSAAAEADAAAERSARRRQARARRAGR